MLCRPGGSGESRTAGSGGTGVKSTVKEELMPDVNIKISTKQREFLEAKEPLVIFRGGIRSGKTRVAAIKAVLNALACRKQLFMSVDYPQARDAVVPTFKDVLLGCWKDGVYYPGFQMKEGVDFTYNKTDMDICIGGTYIHMRSAERMDRLRGISASDAFIDEGRDIRDRSLYDILLGRLSDQIDAQMFLTSSARGKDWMWDLAQDNPDCHLIVQKTSENPFLPAGFIKRIRRNYTSQFAAQELDSDIIEFGGDIIKSAWFKKVAYVKPTSGVRYWDVAVSTKTSADYSVGALCNYVGDSFRLSHVVRGLWNYPDLKRKIIETAVRDGTGIIIGIEEVGVQRGFIDDLRREKQLRPYTIKTTKPRGDKFARALPWISKAEFGFFQVCIAPWNEEFFEECDAYRADGKSKHDDQVDAVSGAHAALTHKSVARSVRQNF